MKRGIRRVPALWRASRLLRRWYHARYDAYPDWEAILKAEPALWEAARRSATGGYSVEELRAHEPWRLFEELPPPDEFLRLVGQGSDA